MRMRYRFSVLVVVFTFLNFSSIASNVVGGCNPGSVAEFAPRYETNHFGIPQFQKRVLVTGATGFIGSAMVDMLLAQGQLPLPLVRNHSKATRLSAIVPGLQFGDLSDKNALLDATKHVDVVIHTAAKVGDWGPRKAYYEANLEGTRNLLDAAVANGVRRVILFSTADVFGVRRNTVVDDSFPLRKSSHPYADSKVEVEELARDYASRYGLEVTFIRPTWVFGPGDKNFFPELLKTMGTVYITHPDNKISLNYIDNLMLLTWLVMANDASIGQGYLSDDSSPISWRELMTQVSHHTGKRVPYFGLPRGVRRSVGLGMEILLRTGELSGLGHLVTLPDRPLLSRYVIDFLGSNLTYRPTKAMSELQYAPIVSTEEGIRRALESLGALKP